MRVALDGVRAEPDSVVAPGTSLVVYIALHNSGSCAWPAESALVYSSDVDLGAPEAFPMGALAPSETIQAILPLSAPEAAGSYQAVWRMREAGGRKFGSRIVLEITVDDSLPRATATPIPVPPIETPVPQPLALQEPVLVSWQDDPALGLWAGTVEFPASGGTGTYTFYQGEIRDDTQLEGSSLTFKWRRCAPYSIELTVLSGAEILYWSGEVPYPAPERCN